MASDGLEGIVSLSGRMLQDLNSSRSPEEVIGDALSSVKSFSGIEAIAIRKKEGDDYPYYIHDGFSDSFVKRENYLCSYLDSVALKYEDGSPRLECICGAVLQGKTYNLGEYFTDKGSFWTNSISDLLERKYPDVPDARGYCYVMGYESMAIIPLNVKGDTIGTLQMNDARKNMFSAEDVIGYERLGEIIGAVIQRKDLEQQIAERQDFLQSTLDCLPSNIAVLSIGGTIISTNKAWRDFAAQNATSPVKVSEGVNYLDICRDAEGYQEEYASRFAEAIRHVILGQTDSFYEEYPCDSPTEDRWYLGYIRPFDENAPKRVVVSHVDITERKKDALELERIAYTDPKTGVANRAGLQKRFEQYKNGEMGVISISVGDMDFINMAYGSRNGDRFLTKAAEKMKAIRDEDCLARISAAEFACLFTAHDEPLDVYELLEDMKTPLEVGDTSIAPSVKAGISLYPQDGDNLDALLQRAEMARSNAGINEVTFYTSRDERASYLLQLDKDLDTAIEMDDFDEFELYCQTIVEAASRRTVGFENLLRWHHPVYGRVSPGDFIPLMEKKRDVLPFSRAVIRKSCENYNYCIQEGKDPGLVTMNLSARDLFSEEIEKYITSTIHEYGIQPSKMGIELTETAVMQDPAEGFKRLNRLSSYGIRILLDDFGTGQSSLSYLSHAPEGTIVKIDKGFLDKVRQDPHTDKLVTGVSRLVKELGMEVLAEGVERPEQEGFIYGVGGDYCQGFLYSRPSKVTEIVDHLADL